MSRNHDFGSRYYFIRSSNAFTNNSFVTFGSALKTPFYFWMAIVIANAYCILVSGQMICLDMPANFACVLVFLYYKLCLFIPLIVVLY
jgi:hypothetical protein